MKRGAGIKKKGAANEPQGLDKSAIAKTMGVDPEGEPDVFEFLSRALDFPLPEPWTEHTDKKGRIFYWNPASRQSSWTHPLASTHKQLVSAYRHIMEAKGAGEDPQILVLSEIEEFHRQGEEELNQWRVSNAEDGTPYFYKTGTQQTRWDNPRDELVSHQELRIQMLSHLLEPELGEHLETQPELPITTTPAPASRENRVGEIDPKRSLGADFDKAARVENSATSSMFGGSQGLRSALSGKGAPGVSPIRSPSPGGSALSTPGVGLKAPPSRESSQGGRLQALSSALVIKEFDELHFSARESSSPMPGIRCEDALVSPPLTSPLASLQEQVLFRRGGDSFKALYDGTDVDWVDPEQIAAKLDIDFDDDADRASFHILKPIITQPLPAPWRGFRHKTGQTDFYHPGSSEYRTRHPMMGFFKELLTFLRTQSATDAPMVGPLSAMVFKEVSPQSVRQRLGVWEGPFEVVPSAGGGAATFARLLPGIDEACLANASRRDDPRVEAAANLMLRMDAWCHLWNGFCPDEPFPFSENRIPALVTQLSEAVVIAPGSRADKETVLHQWNWELERRSDAVPQMKQPLLPEEEAVQHEVTALLGAAYGVALSVVAAHDAPYASNKAITTAIRKNIFRAVASRDFKADEVILEEEEDDTYEDERNEEDFEEESEGEQLSESEDEEPSKLERSASDIAIQPQVDKLEESSYSDSELPESPESKTRLEQSIDMNVDLGAEADAEEMYESEEIIVGDVGTFLQFDEDPESWANFVLRPLTPRQSIQTPIPRDIRSPLASMMRRPKGFDEDVWATRNYLKDAVVKPFVSDLGWRCHLEINRGMWSEAEEEPKTVIDTALATSPWLVEAALSPAGEAASPGATLTATPRSTAQQGFVQTSDSGAPSIPPTPSQYRGIPLPPTALEQIRQTHEAEIKVFKDRLTESSLLFDKCLVQRQENGTRPSTPLVAPYEDIDKLEDPLYPKPRSKYLMEKEAAPRKALKRAHLPIREKVSGDSSMYDMPCPGCVPPVSSPQPTPRAGYPKPPYLQGALKKNVWGLRRERPRSAERIPKEKRAQYMNVELRARSADARARKARTSLLPEENDIGAKMAVEQIKFFLSRKCGTVEAAFSQIDAAGKGFITMQEWVDGLQRLEYEKMEYARGMFKILDSRKHYALTISDLLGTTWDGKPSLLKQSAVAIYEGFPEPGLGATMAELLEEVLAEEMGSVVNAALGDVMLSALRQPQPPINELLVEDFVVWLKSKKAKAKPKKKAGPVAEEQQESEIDEAGVIVEGSDSKKVNKAGKIAKMPRPVGGESSGSEVSNASRKSPRIQKLPSMDRKVKAWGLGSAKKKSKPKINLRNVKIGVLGLGKMMSKAAHHEEENSTVAASEEAQTSKSSAKPQSSNSSKGGLQPGVSKGTASNRSTSDRSISSNRGRDSSRGGSGARNRGKGVKSARSKMKLAAAMARKSEKDPQSSPKDSDEYTSREDDEYFSEEDDEPSSEEEDEEVPLDESAMNESAHTTQGSRSSPKPAQQKTKRVKSVKKPKTKPSAAVAAFAPNEGDEYAAREEEDDVSEEDDEPSAEEDEDVPVDESAMNESAHTTQGSRSSPKQAQQKTKRVKSVKKQKTKPSAPVAAYVPEEAAEEEEDDYVSEEDDEPSSEEEEEEEGEEVPMDESAMNESAHTTQGSRSLAKQAQKKTKRVKSVKKPKTKPSAPVAAFALKEVDGDASREEEDDVSEEDDEPSSEEDEEDVPIDESAMNENAHTTQGSQFPAQQKMKQVVAPGGKSEKKSKSSASSSKSEREATEILQPSHGSNKSAQNETKVAGATSSKSKKDRRLPSPAVSLDPGSAREASPKQTCESPLPSKPQAQGAQPGKSRMQQGESPRPGKPTQQQCASRAVKSPRQQDPRPGHPSAKQRATSSPGSTGQSFRSSSRATTSQHVRPSAKKRIESSSGPSLQPTSEQRSPRSLSPETELTQRRPVMQAPSMKQAAQSSKVQIGGSKPSSIPRRRKQPGEDVQGAILSTRLGPAPLEASVAGKGHRTKQKQQAYSDSDTKPNYGNADFSHHQLDGGHGFIQQHQRRIPAKQQPQTGGYPSSAAPRPCFDVGYHDPVGGYPQPRPPSEMLPWCPRGPNEVCKTYSHIFKLLNDPQLKKKLPKPKLSVHVSMPRLQAAGSVIGGSSQHSACDEDEVGALSDFRTGSLRSGMIGSNSAPDLHVSSMDFDIGPSRVVLPPLAKSAPSKAHGPGGFLAGGAPPTTVASH